MKVLLRCLTWCLTVADCWACPGITLSTADVWFLEKEHSLGKTHHQHQIFSKLFQNLEMLLLNHYFPPYSVIKQIGRLLGFCKQVYQKRGFKISTEQFTACWESVFGLWIALLIKVSMYWVSLPRTTQRHVSSFEIRNWSCVGKFS